MSDLDLDAIEHKFGKLWPVDQLVSEVRDLRELLVKAEGYALSQGADLPFVAMFAEDSRLCGVIERAGCYPRNARREHPGRFALNPPPVLDVSDDRETTCCTTLAKSGTCSCPDREQNIGR